MATRNKSIFKQVMTRGDYAKLAILLAFAVFCWSWVWFEYQKPFDYQVIELKVLGENNIKG